MKYHVQIGKTMKSQLLSIDEIKQKLQTGEVSLDSKCMGEQGGWHEVKDILAVEEQKPQENTQVTNKHTARNIFLGILSTICLVNFIEEPRPSNQIKLIIVAIACVTTGCILLYTLAKRTKTQAATSLAASPTDLLKYGTVWQRTFGALIDDLLLLPLGLLILWLNHLSKTTALIDMVPMVAISLGYNIYCSGRFGQTVGMWLEGIRIVKVDGRAIGWREAWLRSSIRIIFDVPDTIAGFIALLSIPDTAYYGVDWWQQTLNLVKYYPWWYLILHRAGGIWFGCDILAIVLNKKRRALHDFIAGTIVIVLPKKEQIVSAANISETKPPK